MSIYLPFVTLEQIWRRGTDSPGAEKVSRGVKGNLSSSLLYLVLPGSLSPRPSGFSLLVHTLERGIFHLFCAAVAGMLSVLALGMGPNPAGTYSETEAEPETAGHVACELAAAELIGLFLKDWSSPAWHIGDPDGGMVTVM